MSSTKPNPSLAHPLAVIDPYVDTSRNEGEARMSALRPLLRLFARSVDSMALVDPASDASFGALMASRRKADLGGPIVESILSGKSSASAAVAICLVRPTVSIITAQEADELDNNEREKCIAILGDDKLARPTEDVGSVRPHVILTVPKGVAGGSRDAKMDIERVSPTCVKIGIVSSSGSRRYMTSGELPSVVVEKVFAATDAAVQSVPCLGPKRSNELTSATKLAIVDFLERKVRLQVLCTSAMPAPISRPVVLDRVHLREFSEKNESWASVRASLHPSSSSCICGSHGLRFDWEGRVEVNLETCGRPLEEGIDGGMCCPCHHQAVDASGNSRFSMRGVCTEGTRVTVTCFHRSGSACKRGVVIDDVKLNDVERLELSTILINVLEFEGRTQSLFNSRGWATDQANIDRHAKSLGEKLAEQLKKVQASQLEREDAEETNPRAMMQRDMISVDLMRGGGVFRHTVKRGERRGCPYLARAKRTEETIPLKPHESELISSHGHLFRKGA
jgi:hypothetical protein